MFGDVKAHMKALEDKVSQGLNIATKISNELHSIAASLATLVKLFELTTDQDGRKEKKCNGD